MSTDQFLDEAETIYTSKLVSARTHDFDLAVYMAKRLEQRSKAGAECLRHLCKTKPQFKRAFIISDSRLKKGLQLDIQKTTHSPISY